jgi:gluconate 2-dehydrogenase gamma chain
MIQKTHKTNNNKLWELSRRSFVKLSLLGGLISQIPLVNSCIRENEKGEIIVVIDETDYTIELELIQTVQKILFPKDELGPGALELKSDIYLIWVLNDHRLDPWDHEYIIKGFHKLDSASKEEFNARFTKLNSKQQENLIARISLIDWGQDWLSKMLTLIFESMFANPNYGSNPEGIGWKWLNHQAGFPQPKEDQIYPHILEINKQKFKSQ